MRFDVLTLFPEMFPDYLGQSLLKLAIERKLVQSAREIGERLEYLYERGMTTEDLQATPKTETPAAAVGLEAPP